MRVEIVDARAVADLRRAVLRPELPAGQPLPPFVPDGGGDAIHLGAFDEKRRPVGTCVVFPEVYPGDRDRPGTWQLRAMATAPERRGSGIGAAVLAAAVSQVRARGGNLLWCNARLTALGFYERHGWTAEGEVFAGGPMKIPHRRMRRELAPPPTSSDQVDPV